MAYSIRFLAELTNVPNFQIPMTFAGGRFFGLDYDGTLASFPLDGSQAYPLPGMELSFLSGELHVTFIGGNGVDDVY
ncbi:MAG: hypothetical protein ABSH41_16875 [Syntrophobacteraceae bacterium]|jgi:hypothetical protein